MGPLARLLPGAELPVLLTSFCFALEPNRIGLDFPGSFGVSGGDGGVSFVHYPKEFRRAVIHHYT